MSAATARRKAPAPRILTGMQSAMCASMVADLPHECDLGDERAIMRALAGSYAPGDILDLLDLVTEAARESSARRALADPYAAALYTFALAPAVALATLLPGPAHAQDLVEHAGPPAWPLWIFAALFIASALWLVFGRSPPARHDDDDADDESRRYRDLAQ